MSFTVENLEEKNMVKLVIESTAEEFEAGLNTAYNKNKSKISLPGFRKGKAPRKMIEKMYGAEVFYEDAANSIIPDAYAKAADECGLELVSQPKINVTQLEAGCVFSSTGFSMRSILSNIFSRLSARLIDFSRLKDFSLAITSS